MKETEVLSADDLARSLTRIGHEIVEGNPSPETVVVVGIHTRGAVLASRLVSVLADLTASEIPLGELDIAFYRDDLSVRTADAQPVVHSTRLDFPIEDKTVILVDDVLFTGRTVRAGIDALFDYGRPARVQLAVLCDRGHRELPIRPDYVGKNLPTAAGERVSVLLEETDGRDGVILVSPVEAVE